MNQITQPSLTNSPGSITISKSVIESTIGNAANLVNQITQPPRLGLLQQITSKPESDKTVENVLENVVKLLKQISPQPLTSTDATIEMVLASTAKLLKHITIPPSLKTPPPPDRTIEFVLAYTAKLLNQIVPPPPKPSMKNVAFETANKLKNKLISMFASDNENMREFITESYITEEKKHVPTEDEIQALPQDEQAKKIKERTEIIDKNNEIDKANKERKVITRYSDDGIVISNETIKHEWFIEKKVKNETGV